MNLAHDHNPQTIIIYELGMNIQTYSDKQTNSKIANQNVGILEKPHKAHSYEKEIIAL
jgi:hypothetical protein